jgi:FtsH-binding integral membrane protein
MSPRPDPVDPQVIKKRALLRRFYFLAFASAAAFGLASSLHKPLQEILFALSFLGATLAVVTLYRFLRLIDQFEREYTRGALLVAFVGLVGVLVIEAFMESFGFGHLPAYGNVLVAVILWTIGLAYSSWQHHWRRGYEE